MRHLTHAFTIPDTATELLEADGTLLYANAARFVDKTVQVFVSGTINATIALEGTCDGTNWVGLQSITQSSIVYVQPSVTQLRVKISDWLAGSVSATFAGFDPRTGY